MLGRYKRFVLLRGFCRGGWGIPTRVPAPEVADGLGLAQWADYMAIGLRGYIYIVVIWHLDGDYMVCFVLAGQRGPISEL